MATPAQSPFHVQVAVPSPLRGTFDYLPLPDQPLPQPGSRVKVTFGRRELVGIVTGLSSDTEVSADKLRPLLALLEDSPLLDAHLLALYRWASSYYLYPLGQALQTSLPKALREGKPMALPARMVWQLKSSAEPAASPAKKRSSTQLQVLDLLHTYQQLSTSELSALLNKSARAVLQTLENQHVVEQTAAAEGALTPAHRAEPALVLSAEQQAALAAMSKATTSFSCFLLEGITGSGKTEIYLQLIEQVLAAGKQVLVLVPEISLTPQTVSRFASRFHARIVAFHSGLTDKQRLQGWLEARNGTAHIVIGTRSAVFTPLARPGLIVIDEEHDDSYKQQEGFRYSARDVAIYRASMLKIPVLLGSATPSLESLHNALNGRYQLLTLSQRAGSAQLPTVRMLDLKLQKCAAGISPLLMQEIGKTLAANQQVLVFLNRRGFAPLLLCRDCGWIAECPRCERSYTLHQQPAALHCHHCGAQKPLPRSCGHCHSGDLDARGLGTERSASVLTEHFPDYPVLRIDRDSTRAVGQLDSLMDTVHSGIPCILVGTQMLAKGHHFPRVTLVAVLDADSGLFSADFRAQENLGQLLTQVAGRAGRSDAPGQVIVQTWHPTHPALLQLAEQGYQSFARQLLQERASGSLPPYVHFMLIRAEANSRELPLQFLQEVAQQLQLEPVRDLRCFGPMPSPFGKKAGVFRAQLILQAPKRSTLQKLGDHLLTLLESNSLSRKVRWLIDVDPTDFRIMAAFPRQPEQPDHGARLCQATSTPAAGSAQAKGAPSQQCSLELVFLGRLCRRHSHGRWLHRPSALPGIATGSTGSSRRPTDAGRTARL
ncbi:MAG: primosomal protein N' [Pseudomonadota bacterium]